jgi:hypothetical protein
MGIVTFVDELQRAAHQRQRLIQLFHHATAAPSYQQIGPLHARYETFKRRQHPLLPVLALMPGRSN